MYWSEIYREDGRLEMHGIGSEKGVSGVKVPEGSG